MKWMITLVLCASSALAQSITLNDALKSAWQDGTDVATAQNNYQQALDNLTAKQADPSILIADLTKAQQNEQLSKTQVQHTRLTVMQNVVNAYANLYQLHEQQELYALQTALSQKNLQVATAKLELKNATTLDVQNAKNELASSLQNESDAKAQLPVLQQKLSNLLGSDKLFTASAVKINQANIAWDNLSAGLAERLPSVLSAKQAVDLNTLSVKLYDNDFTPKRTLDDARVQLQNSLRTLGNSQNTANTDLSDSYRSYQNALEQQSIALQKEANQQQSYSQDQTRFKNGLISAVQLQQSQVSLKQAQFSRTQAQLGVLKALAGLSLASGQNLTGLGAE